MSPQDLRLGALEGTSLDRASAFEERDRSGLGSEEVGGARSDRASAPLGWPDSRRPLRAGFDAAHAGKI